MKIDRVVKKDDANVIIYFNNQEKLFLSYEVFMENRLKKDMEISEDGFSFLIRENQKYFIKKKVFGLLGRRLHSYSELKLKLMQKKYDKDMVTEVLDQLKGKGILDDYKFGKQYTEEKIRLKSWGRNKLKAELIRKGVAAAVIDKILTEEDLSPAENAKVIAVKKLKLLVKRRYDNRELASRLSAYLYSKGYDYDTIREVVASLVNEDDSI
jgi:regulatory protein